MGKELKALLNGASPVDDDKVSEAPTPTES
jgi:hypothetical protein